MKFVINTNYKAAGTKVLDGIVNRLKSEGHQVTLNDWENYSNYDIALFMAPDSAIRKAKKINPKIVCGLFDPKASRSWQIKENKEADFLIVSSIEQREFFLKYNKNIFIYYMFPDIPETKKEHTEKKKIIIGYHGNKQHLDAMKGASWALDQIAQNHDIEFHVVYNIEKLGKWVLNTPKICPIKHIQWSEDTFIKDLNQCDIGIVPSIIPAPKFFARPFWSFFYNPVSYVGNDYVNRFKMSNNPGRIYVFSQLHIPIITDFTPSASEIIKDGQSGILVGSNEGWVRAFDMLIKDSGLRNKFSSTLKSSIDSNFSIDTTFKNFIDFLNSINMLKKV